MYIYHCETTTWANVHDLYDRYGQEFVDKLAIRNNWNEEFKAYVASEDEVSKMRVLTLAICDAKELIKRKIQCKYKNISLLDEKLFYGIKQWHIKLTIDTLKLGGDCMSCDCTELDKFLDCNSICSTDGVCLPSKGTFLTASVAHFECECLGRCKCC